MKRNLSYVANVFISMLYLTQTVTVLTKYANCPMKKNPATLLREADMFKHHRISLLFTVIFYSIILAAQYSSYGPALGDASENGGLLFMIVAGFIVLVWSEFVAVAMITLDKRFGFNCLDKLYDVLMVAGWANSVKHLRR